VFDFPSPATLGQQVVSPTGAVFLWDGAKWGAAKNNALAAGAGGFLPLTGGNLLGGLGFVGVATSYSDLSQHINLAGGTTGINSYGGGMNICVPVGEGISFLIGGTSTGYINNTGMNWVPIGQQGQSTGTFTTLTGNGLHINGTISSQTDLANGIDLNAKAVPGTCGITGYSGNIYLVGGSISASVNFNCGTTPVGYIDRYGMNYIPIGQTAAALGAFSTIAVGSATGPTWTQGTTAPSSTQPVGSLYSRVGGAIGATLYVSRGAGTWAAVAGV
jgi:hypothetical protein